MSARQETYEFALRLVDVVTRSLVGAAGSVVGGVGLVLALPGNLLWFAGKAIMTWSIRE